jgi:glyoxylase-like metal-dependent hydrolase (beta-lactamase superfamily II)
MIEKIFPGFYRIEVPLPNSPLKALNSYLIKGQERFLIIDTGMNREECFGPMHSSLEKLGVDIRNADFFITHLHADHLGLVERLATETSKVYFSEVEASVVTSIRERKEKRFNELFQFYLSNAFPEEELRKAVENHPGFRYSPTRQINFTVLKEESTLKVGDYAFRCIQTPGHSPGHMCLYEPEKKILVSGDHILSDITPNITRWPERENALKAYLTSLEKVYPLDVDLVLPGHRSIFKDHRKRIAELQDHHRRRLAEILDALRDGNKTAWDVAPHVTWDIRFKSWGMFPPVQKWFAMGEVIAHLHYLEAEGKIRRQEDHGKVSFAVVSEPS